MSEDTKPNGVEPEGPKFRVKSKHIRSVDAGYSLYGSFEVTLPEGIELEWLTHPQAWSMVAHLFNKDPMSGGRDRMQATIKVRTEDMAYLAELYVMAVRPTELDVKILSKTMLQDDVVPVRGDLQVRWNLGKRGWDIVRPNGKAFAVVEAGDKYPTKALAYARIAELNGSRVAA